MYVSTDRNIQTVKKIYQPIEKSKIALVFNQLIKQKISLLINQLFKRSLVHSPFKKQPLNICLFAIGRD
jgi:hypothetical protein